MPRVPLLSGSSIAVVDAPEGAVVLRPPAPTEAIVDVGAAVRDALRFPLAGPALQEIAPRNGRATIVAEPPSLPLPGADHDPRQAALAAAVDELARAGVPVERQTILIAGGLARRPGRAELELLAAPELARRFRGRLEVHDAEDPRLVELEGTDGARVHPALVETDLVLVVGAAETVLHGGPASLLGATGAATLRRAQAVSLLEPAGSEGWRLAVGVERALARRVPVIGASLALNNPVLSGAALGYPYEEQALERIARSRMRYPYALLPGRMRRRMLRSLPRQLTAASAFGGPPSVAHTEALLRAVEARQTTLVGELDAICIGVPDATPYLPRERPNPLLVAYLALALALRLWRDAFPVVEGGTAILLNGFRRQFAHPTQQPYRALFQATRTGRDAEQLAAAERAAVADAQAIERYRSGHTCHPALPFADWEACAPALERLGAVLVAGCRDAAAARQLGFVPTHGIGAALGMARGRAGRQPRLGVLLSPPYFPLRVVA